MKKVIIIGAGPAGVAAALHLLQSNQILSIIYEIRPEPTTLGGAIGIPSNGLRLLHRLGVYEALAARGASTPNLLLQSVKGRLMGQMNVVSWSQEKTGFGYLRIRRTDLMDVLLAAAKKADVPIQYGKRLVGIDEDDRGVTVTFSDGTSDTADFLLGCDGIHSAVRTLYVDPQITPAYSGISNIFSLLFTAELPAASRSLKGMHATVTADGLFALTPCTASSDMVYWFFSRQVPLPASGDTRDGWEQHGKKEIEGLKATLLSLLGDARSEQMDLLREVVRQTQVLKFYPIFRITPGAKWSRGRCLIIGDAAHAMPPHASQGVSMAMEDVFLFSRILHAHPDSLEHVISTYEEKRRSRVEEMYKRAERNGTMRKKASPWRLWFNELAISGAMWVYWICNLDRLGLGQGPLAYDIEEEQV